MGLAPNFIFEKFSCMITLKFLPHPTAFVTTANEQFTARQQEVPQGFMLIPGKMIRMRNSFRGSQAASLKAPEVRVKTWSPLLAAFLWACHSKHQTPTENQKN